MNTTKLVYWICQVLGWGSYSGIGLWFATRQAGWRPSIVIGYALFFCYSIALTHLLSRRIQSHRWLSLPLGRAFPRLAGGSVAVGSVQTLLVIGVSAALEGRLGAFGQAGTVLAAWLGITVATSIWTVLYVAYQARLHALRFQLALREAELRALEAQIKPHFLFNCLNTIRGMIVEDAAQAQDMITRLANILRYNLQHDRAHTVPLARELEVVSDYLALESVRFENRLRVSLDIAPEAAQAPVPAMLLQTLVENAVKHGIATLPEGGELVIRATLEQGAVAIQVENSGHLVEPRPGSTRIGLNNARERLRILYGERATLRLESGDHGRVTATVLIPKSA